MNEPDGGTLERWNIIERRTASIAFSTTWQRMVSEAAPLGLRQGSSDELYRDPFSPPRRSSQARPRTFCHEEVSHKIS